MGNQCRKLLYIALLPKQVEFSESLLHIRDSSGNNTGTGGHMKKLLTTLTAAFYLGTVTFSLCCIGVRQSCANGIYVDGTGPVSNGRGGTNIAHSDNGTVIHDNPSALAALKGKRLEACFDFLVLPMSYRDPQNDEDGKNRLLLLPSFSYSQKMPQRPFGIGFGVYTSAGFSTEYRLVHPAYGKQKYASDASMTKMLLGVGWQMTNQWSLGLGAGPAYSRVAFEEPYTFQTGIFREQSVLVDMKGDDWALAWNLGVQWHIVDSTTLGLAYVNQDRFHLRGDADIQGLPLSDPTAHYQAAYDFKWPQTLGLGITHRFNTIHKISTDVMWIDWSSAFDELTIKLTDGDNAELNAVAGNSVQDVFPLHWKDSYAFRLGYEYLWTPVDTLRLGYAYNLNPVPDSTLTPMIPGIMTHLVSFGYGHTWDKWAFNAAYIYSFGPRQSVGNSKIIGDDYDQSSTRISAHFLSVGAQYQF